MNKPTIHTLILSSLMLFPAFVNAMLPQLVARQASMINRIQLARVARRYDHRMSLINLSEPTKSPALKNIYTHYIPLKEVIRAKEVSQRITMFSLLSQFGKRGNYEFPLMKTYCVEYQQAQKKVIAYIAASAELVYLPSELEENGWQVRELKFATTYWSAKKAFHSLSSSLQRDVHCIIGVNNSCFRLQGDFFYPGGEGLGQVMTGLPYSLEGHYERMIIDLSKNYRDLPSDKVDMRTYYKTDGDKMLYHITHIQEK